MIVDLSQLRVALNLVSTHLVVVDTGLDGAELDAYVEAQALVDDAARLFLAEREGGQKVWWCEEHRAASSAEDDEELCEVAGMVMFLEAVLPERPCRMVEAWLTVETPE